MSRSDVLRAGPAWLALVAFAVAGCASQSGDSGELGQASLLPPCANCTYSGAPLAVGASQLLDVKGTFGGSRGVPITLRAVDSQVVSTEGLTLRGVAPGVTAILALTPQGRVLDFFNLTAVSADRLSLAVVDGGGVVRGELGERVTWLTGDDRTVRVVPAAGAQELAGHVDATLTSSSALVTIVPGVGAGEWRLVARSAGTAQITIAAVGITRELAVEVLP